MNQNLVSLQRLNAPEPKHWCESLSKEQLIAEVKRLDKRVQDLEKRVTGYMWLTNPDRMGK
jgi:hypothetical protein